MSDPALRWSSPRTWPRGDRFALSSLCGVALVLFVVPALVGHPAIAGDNLLQNYPLRVLVGRQLDQGHLPVWNPYADSGTPLLAGLNAGAFFPATFLFAVLPGLVAWVVGLLFVYIAAALGVYALVRWLHIGPLGAGLAAATYAFGGAMVGQLNHLGVIQGQAVLPWLVLSQLALGKALLSLTSRTPWHSVVRVAAPGVVGIAVSMGLLWLTGEPRSIADAEMVAVTVLACELVVPGATRSASAFGRLIYLLASVAGIAWGVCLSLAQMLPGWGFITVSERSSISYTFFGSGSIDWRWLSFLFSPGLLGDNGVFHTPRYFGEYNLPEVTDYVGLVAMTALFAFVAQLCWRKSEAPRRRLAVFVVLCVVGLVLTMGATTPLGPVLHDIPLLGSTRLQNRNIILFDLGAVVVLGWWVDALARSRLAEASITGWRRWVTAAPLAFTALLGVIAMVSPGFVTQVLLAAPGTAWVAPGIRITVGLSLVLAVVVGVVLFRTSSTTRNLARTLVVVALADLFVFNIFFQSSLVSGLDSPYSSTTTANAQLGITGRYAVVDPAGMAYHETARLGYANLDVYTRLHSVQGYGSLISARYAEATGTKLLGRLNGCALQDGVFNQLRLATVVVSRSALVFSPTRPYQPRACGPPRMETSATRYLGEVVRVTSVRFADPWGFARHGTPSVEVLDANGRPERTPITLARTATTVSASFPAGPLAVGVRLRDPAGFRLSATILDPLRGPPELLSTAMQLGLDTPTWRFVAIRGPLSFFRATHVRPPAWFAKGDATGVVASEAMTSTGSATMRVTTSTPGVLVRSEAWLPGWTATLRDPAGTVRSVAVLPHGLVQSVAVPPGTWVVAFDYHAPHLVAGLVASLVALVALLAALAWLLVQRRRARAAPHDASEPTTEPSSAVR